jgi:glycosyltransferase involved in cell wall biosynthesis
MKILYISHQKEESGYGRYCREFLKSLKTTNLEISSVAVPLGKVGKYKEETEDNNLENIDVVIQNILPHFMSKGHVKCIGGAILENLDVKKNVWGSHLSLMDEVWYPHNKLNLFKKEQEIPTAIELDKFQKELPSLRISEVDGTYKFYWIGEYSNRKNLEGLIKAYFMAFSHSDPVSLIIKVHKNNFNENECHKEISELINKIGYGLKIYQNPKDYPRIVIIPEFWTEEQIYSLHKYCDCFVSSSHGESINYPMIDALLCNNHVISTDTFASQFYMKYGKIEFVVSDNTEPCFGQNQTFSWYQTGFENWNSFNSNLFSQKMQKVVNSSKSDNDLSSLSYINVGKKIKKSLEECVNR